MYRGTLKDRKGELRSLQFSGRTKVETDTHKMGVEKFTMEEVLPKGVE